MAIHTRGGSSGRSFGALFDTLGTVLDGGVGAGTVGAAIAECVGTYEPLSRKMGAFAESFAAYYVSVHHVAWLQLYLFAVHVVVKACFGELQAGNSL